jgi:outer membrane protein
MARGKWHNGLRLKTGLAGLMLLLLAGCASGETLPEALRSAFNNNPALLAQRAQLKAAGEEMAIARAAFFPKLSVSAGVGTSLTTGVANDHAVTVSAAVDQTIFDGLRTVSAVNEAQAREKASGQDLRALEQTTLLDAVSAYVDVIRERAVAEFRQQDVDRLAKEAAATRLRSANGDATKFDIDLSEARRARAEVALSAARAARSAAEANYKRIIGHPPGRLEPPRTPKTLPKSEIRAVEIARVENPAVLGALHRWEASHHATEKSAGDLLPSVSLRAEYGRTMNSADPTNNGDTASAHLVIPLSDGGAARAQWRQARHIEQSQSFAIEDVRAKVEANVATVWAQLAAARAQLAMSQKAVSASTSALEGIKQERKLAQLSMLDVLNSEQELVEAQVLLAQARRDSDQAAFGLLHAVGALSLEDLQMAGSDTAPARPAAVSGQGNARSPGWAATISR